MHVVGHDHKFVQHHVGKMVRQAAPGFLHDHTRGGKYNHPIHHRTQHGVASARDDGHVIPAGLGVVISGQAGGMAVADGGGHRWVSLLQMIIYPFCGVKLLARRGRSVHGLTLPSPRIDLPPTKTGDCFGCASQ